MNELLKRVEEQNKTNELIKLLSDYLINDTEVCQEVVTDLAQWDGSFEHLKVHYNDEYFFNTFYEANPMEAIKASFYGEYNFMDTYVRFNGYGNLETLNKWDYEEELKSECPDIAVALILNESWNHCDVIQNVIIELITDDLNVKLEKMK